MSRCPFNPRASKRYFRLSRTCECNSKCISYTFCTHAAHSLAPGAEVQIEHGFTARYRETMYRKAALQIEEVAPTLIHDTAEMAHADIAGAFPRWWVWGRAQGQVCAQ